MHRGAIALVVLASASLAAADPLANAKAQVAASEYLNARTSLDAAYSAGTAGPEQLAEIWRLRGIVAGALGDAKTATDAFQKSLVLDPKAELPPGTSPKITRPFVAAQEALKGQAPLSIRQETRATPPSVAVAIVSDPLAMIATIRVIVRADGAADQTLEKKNAGQEQIEIALPAGARLDLRVAALDEKGNRLVELGSADVPIVIVGKPVKPDKPAVVLDPTPRKPPAPVRERPLYWKWWLWGGGAIVFAGAATYFGVDGLIAKSELEDLNAESTRHTFDEAKDLEARARRGFLVANIGYGVAGALAITATILWLTEPEAGAERATRVTAMPLDGGGAIVLGGHF